MKSILTKAVKFYANKRSWKTNKKIIVIESDDWGGIRMPNSKVFEKLSRINHNIAHDPYSKFDSLAGQDDLELLFECLSNFKDKNDNSPIITANAIVGNPDFNKIASTEFENYNFETFDKTIKRTNNGDKVLKLWTEGIDHKLFKPQLHGREHVHAILWLEELKQGNKELIEAFKLECFGVPYNSVLKNKRKNLMSALDYHGLLGEERFQEEYIRDSSRIFKNIFGYVSKSFIAPAYIWRSNNEKILKEEGIDYIQGLALQYIPDNYKQKFRRKLHYFGEKNKYDQFYLTRNVFFEPSPKPNKDWVNDALANINLAFSNKLPAIISSHRINFIGSLVPGNRDKNLILLSRLLKKVIQKWPDTEFMSSNELGDLIYKEKSI